MTGIVVPGKLYGAMASGRPDAVRRPRALRVGRHDPPGRLRPDGPPRRRRRPGRGARPCWPPTPSWPRRWARAAARRSSPRYEKEPCCARWSAMIADLVSARAPRPGAARRDRRRWPCRCHARTSVTESPADRPRDRRSPRTRFAIGELSAMNARHLDRSSWAVLGRGRSSARADGPPHCKRRRDPGRARPRPDPRPGGLSPRHPKADDLDQAYMTLFDKAIEHDWFAEHEALARPLPGRPPRRAGPVAGADRRDDGAAPGRPVRRGAGPVPTS